MSGPRRVLYVETNFLLTAAKQQEGGGECDRLLDAAEVGTLDLRVPAFSLAEAHRTLYGQRRRREEFADAVRREADELGRSRHLRELIAEPLRAIELDLIRSVTQEADALRNFRRRLIDAAAVLPTDADVSRRVFEVEDETDLDPSDATVFAAVLHDLHTTKPSASRFVTTNTKDFFERSKKRNARGQRVGPPKQPIAALLDGTGCELLSSFGDAAEWAFETAE